MERYNLLSFPKRPTESSTPIQPKNNVQSNDLTMWKRLPCDNKYFLPSLPTEDIQLSVKPLGESLYENFPNKDFDLSERVVHPTLTYSSLNDPHLRHYFRSPGSQRHLVRKGLVTPDGRVKTKLEDYNQYRTYLHHLWSLQASQLIRHQEIEEKKRLETLFEAVECEDPLCKKIVNGKDRLQANEVMKELSNIFPQGGMPVEEQVMNPLLQSLIEWNKYQDKLLKDYKDKYPAIKKWLGDKTKNYKIFMENKINARISKDRKMRVRWEKLRENNRAYFNKMNRLQEAEQENIRRRTENRQKAYRNVWAKQRNLIAVTNNNGFKVQDDSSSGNQPFPTIVKTKSIKTSSGRKLNDPGRQDGSFRESDLFSKTLDEELSEIERKKFNLSDILWDHAEGSQSQSISSTDTNPEVFARFEDIIQSNAVYDIAGDVIDKLKQKLHRVGYYIELQKMAHLSSDDVKNKSVVTCANISDRINIATDGLEERQNKKSKYLKAKRKSCSNHAKLLLPPYKEDHLKMYAKKRRPVDLKQKIINVERSTSNLKKHQKKSCIDRRNSLTRTDKEVQFENGKRNIWKYKHFSLKSYMVPEIIDRGSVESDKNIQLKKDKVEAQLNHQPIERFGELRFEQQLNEGSSGNLRFVPIRTPEEIERQAVEHFMETQSVEQPHKIYTKAQLEQQTVIDVQKVQPESQPPEKSFTEITSEKLSYKGSDKEYKLENELRPVIETFKEVQQLKKKLGSGDKIQLEQQLTLEERIEKFQDLPQMHRDIAKKSQLERQMFVETAQNDQTKRQCPTKNSIEVEFEEKLNEGSCNELEKQKRELVKTAKVQQIREQESEEKLVQQLSVEVSIKDFQIEPQIQRCNADEAQLSFTEGAKEVQLEHQLPIEISKEMHFDKKLYGDCDSKYQPEQQIKELVKTAEEVQEIRNPEIGKEVQLEQESTEGIYKAPIEPLMHIGMAKEGRFDKQPCGCSADETQLKQQTFIRPTNEFQLDQVFPVKSTEQIMFENLVPIEICNEAQFGIQPHKYNAKKVKLEQYHHKEYIKENKLAVQMRELIGTAKVKKARNFQNNVVQKYKRKGKKPNMALEAIDEDASHMVQYVYDATQKSKIKETKTRFIAKVKNENDFRIVKDKMLFVKSPNEAKPRLTSEDNEIVKRTQHTLLKTVDNRKILKSNTKRIPKRCVFLDEDVLNVVQNYQFGIPDCIEEYKILQNNIIWGKDSEHKAIETGNTHFPDFKTIQTKSADALPLQPNENLKKLIKSNNNIQFSKNENLDRKLERSPKKDILAEMNDQKWLPKETEKLKTENNNSTTKTKLSHCSKYIIMPSSEIELTQEEHFTDLYSESMANIEIPQSERKLREKLSMPFYKDIYEQQKKKLYEDFKQYILSDRTLYFSGSQLLTNSNDKLQDSQLFRNMFEENKRKLDADLTNYALNRKDECCVSISSDRSHFENKKKMEDTDKSFKKSTFDRSKSKFEHKNKTAINMPNVFYEKNTNIKSGIKGLLKDMENEIDKKCDERTFEREDVVDAQEHEYNSGGEVNEMAIENNEICNAKIHKNGLKKKLDIEFNKKCEVNVDRKECEDEVEKNNFNETSKEKREHDLEEKMETDFDKKEGAVTNKTIIETFDTKEHENGSKKNKETVENEIKGIGNEMARYFVEEGINLFDKQESDGFEAQLNKNKVNIVIMKKDTGIKIEAFKTEKIIPCKRGETSFLDKTIHNSPLDQNILSQESHFQVETTKEPHSRVFSDRDEKDQFLQEAEIGIMKIEPDNFQNQEERHLEKQTKSNLSEVPNDDVLLLFPTLSEPTGRPNVGIKSLSYQNRVKSKPKRLHKRPKKILPNKPIYVTFDNVEEQMPILPAELKSSHTNVPFTFETECSSGTIDTLENVIKLSKEMQMERYASALEFDQAVEELCKMFPVLSMQDRFESLATQQSFQDYRTNYLALQVSNNSGVREGTSIVLHENLMSALNSGIKYPFEDHMNNFVEVLTSNISHSYVPEDQASSRNQRLEIGGNNIDPFGVKVTDSSIMEINLKEYLQLYFRHKERLPTTLSSIRMITWIQQGNIQNLDSDEAKLEMTRQYSLLGEKLPNAQECELPFFGTDVNNKNTESQTKLIGTPQTETRNIPDSNFFLNPNILLMPSDKISAMEFKNISGGSTYNPDESRKQTQQEAPAQIQQNEDPEFKENSAKEATMTLNVQVVDISNEALDQSSRLIRMQNRLANGLQRLESFITKSRNVLQERRSKKSIHRAEKRIFIRESIQDKIFFAKEVDSNDSSSS